jgi:hypothetical protein
MEFKIGKTIFFLEEGDITQQETEAVVNAANSRLAGGGGVDGAIHRAGGPAIMEECRRIGQCPTGQAVITTGGLLKAAYVIHTVGPIYQGGSEYSAVRQARQSEQQTKNQVDDAQRTAVQNTVQAWETLVAARASAQSTRVAIQANQVALEGVERGGVGAGRWQTRFGSTDG